MKDTMTPKERTDLYALKIKHRSEWLKILRAIETEKEAPPLSITKHDIELIRRFLPELLQEALRDQQIEKERLNIQRIAPLGRSSAKTSRSGSLAPGTIQENAQQNPPLNEKLGGGMENPGIER